MKPRIALIDEQIRQQINEGAYTRLRDDAQRAKYRADHAVWMAETSYAVEATHFEQHMLWVQFAADSMDRPTWVKKPHVWKQLNPGSIREIGRLDGRPVCVELSWADIDAATVLFYNLCSRVTDSEMLEKWLKNELPGVPRSDAMNFHPERR